MPPKPIFARLATEARLKDNQSPLYRWFLKHHDQFAALLDKIARPGWQSIASELSAEGLTTKDGKPITALYARVTWWRAHKSYETKRRHVTRSPAAPKARSEEMTPSVSVPRPLDPDIYAEPSKPRFGPATLRGHAPSVPQTAPPATPAAPPDPPKQNAEEVIAALLGRSIKPKEPK